MTTDVASALMAKSDQLNADDLIGGPIIIEITKVTNLGKGKEQPIIIDYAGGVGRPWKPCKGMGRVLSLIWETTEGKVWIGRKVKIFRNPEVVFGGKEVGGIQISNMSHITEPKTVMITKNRGAKIPFTVQPLIMGGASNVTDTTTERGTLSPNSTPPAIFADDYIADIQSVPTMDGLKHKYAEAAKLFKDSPDFAKINAAKEKRKTELTIGEQSCQNAVIKL